MEKVISKKKLELVEISFADENNHHDSGDSFSRQAKRALEICDLEGNFDMASVFPAYNGIYRVTEVAYGVRSPDPTSTSYSIVASIPFKTYLEWGKPEFLMKDVRISPSS